MPGVALLAAAAVTVAVVAPRDTAAADAPVLPRYVDVTTALPDGDPAAIAVADAPLTSPTVTAAAPAGVQATVAALGTLLPAGPSLARVTDLLDDPGTGLAEPAAVALYRALDDPPAAVTARIDDSDAFDRFAAASDPTSTGVWVARAGDVAVLTTWQPPLNSATLTVPRMPRADDATGTYWLDLPTVSTLTAAGFTATAAPYLDSVLFGGFGPHGEGTYSASFTTDADGTLRITGTLSALPADTSAAPGNAVDLVATAPADTQYAVAATGLGAVSQNNPDGFVAANPFGLGALQDSNDVDPVDMAALLGTGLVISSSTSADPASAAYQIRSVTPNTFDAAYAAYQIATGTGWQPVLPDAGYPVGVGTRHSVPSSDGLVVASTPSRALALASGSLPTLADDATFQRLRSGASDTQPSAAFYLTTGRPGAPIGYLSDGSGAGESTATDPDANPVAVLTWLAPGAVLGYAVTPTGEGGPLTSPDDPDTVPALDPGPYPVPQVTVPPWPGTDPAKQAAAIRSLSTQVDTVAALVRTWPDEYRDRGLGAVAAAATFLGSTADTADGVRMTEETYRFAGNAVRNVAVQIGVLDFWVHAFDQWTRPDAYPPVRTLLRVFPADSPQGQDIDALITLVETKSGTVMNALAPAMSTLLDANPTAPSDVAYAVSLIVANPYPDVEQVRDAQQRLTALMDQWGDAAPTD